MFTIAVWFFFFEVRDFTDDLGFNFSHIVIELGLIDSDNLSTAVHSNRILWQL